MSADPMNDTHPPIEALLIEGYRRMSPTEKLERVSALTRALHELALLDVRRRYPEADPPNRSFGSPPAQWNRS